MEFQTRSEEFGIETFSTIGEALNHAEKDKTVWKISFTIPETQERIRLVNRIVKTESGWILENIYGVR